MSSLRSGASWLLGGGLAGRVIQFAVGVILARLLAPADFGLLVTIQVFTGLAGFLVGIGMGEALVQRRSASARDFNVVFTLYACSCLCIYAVFFLAAPWVAYAFDEPRYTLLMRVSCLSFLWRPWLVIPTVMLRRQMRFALLAQAELVNLLVASLASLLFAANGFEVWSLVVSGQIATFVQIAMVIYVSAWRPALAWEPATIRELVGSGLRFTANDIAVYLRSELVNLFLSRSFGPSAVGLFNKSQSLAVLPVATISGSVYQPLFRALSSHQDDLNNSQYLYLKALTLVTAYCLPIYLLLPLLAEPCVLAIYGPKWRDAGPLLAILALLGPFDILNNIGGAVLAARNRLGTEVRLQVLAVVLALLGACLGSPHGVIGVALGVLPAGMLLAIQMTIVAMRSLQLRARDVLIALGASLKPSLALLVTALITSALLPSEWPEQQALLYCALVGTPALLAYFALMLWMPAARLEEESARWRNRLFGGLGAQ